MKRLWQYIPGAAKRGQAGAYERLKFVTDLVYPGFVLGGPRRTWIDDGSFLQEMRAFAHYGLQDSAERYFNLRGLARHALRREGDFVECGCGYGGSTYVLLKEISGSGRTLHAFDSFAGLPSPGLEDGSVWEAGDFRARQDDFLRLTSLYATQLALTVGEIPDTLQVLAGIRIALLHCDLDLYRGTKDAVATLYPRVAPGGLIVCDDYGFQGEVGARRAFDEVAEVYSETVVELSSGQAFIIKTVPSTDGAGVTDGSVE